MPNSNIRINSITEKDTNQSVEVSKLAPIGSADGAVIYVDTIADLQALDTSGLVEGQAASVQGSEFRWDGSDWEAIGPVNIVAILNAGGDFQDCLDYSADNDVTITCPRGFSVDVSATLYPRAGTKCVFDELHLNTMPDFDGWNLFEVREGQCHFEGLVVDGSNLPSRDMTSDTSNRVTVGTHFNLDPDVETQYSDKTSDSSPKTRNVTVKNCVLKNQPGGFVGGVNVDDVIIEGCIFDTLADSEETIVNGVVARWAQEEGTKCRNWKVIKNDFIMRVEDGVGNVKSVSSNGAESLTVSSNNFLRIAVGDGGDIGLANACFFKRVDGGIMSENTISGYGSAFKSEQDSRGIIVSNNVAQDMRQHSFAAQGSFDVTFIGNTVSGGGGRAFYVSSHGPSDSDGGDCILVGNTVIDPFKNTEESFSSNELRAVFFFETQTGLSMGSVTATGNLIVSNPQDDLEKEPASCFVLYSRQEGGIEEVSIKNNRVKGVFQRSFLSAGLNIDRLDVEDNRVDISASRLVNILALSSQISPKLYNVNISRNYFNLTDGSQGIQMNDPDVKIKGNLTIENNQFYISDLGNTLVFGRSEQPPEDLIDVGVLSVSGNRFNKNLSARVRKGVSAEIFKFNGNVFETDSGDYYLILEGSDLQNPFEIIEICSNTSKGRMHFRFELNSSAHPCITSFGNTSSNRSSSGSAGIEFISGFDADGYIGLNNVNTDPEIGAHGNVPAGLYVL